jgi:hypothetical protein
MKDYLNEYVTERRLQKNTLQSRESEVPEVPKVINDPIKTSSVTFGTDQGVGYLENLLTKGRVGNISSYSNEAEINWRVEVMIPQIPDSGPLPFLVARECVEPEAGCCLSCGEPFGEGDAFRCAACARAVNLALGMVFESRDQDGGKEKRVS